MTAHELARKLLEGPDLPMEIYVDKQGWAMLDGHPEVEPEYNTVYLLAYLHEKE